MATDVNFSAQQYFGFDPRTIASCQLWLDASDSNTVNVSGTNVTSWTDKSGNNRTATAGTATYPVYQQSGLNSKPIITMRGASDYFKVSTNFDSTTFPSLCFFMVVRPATTQPNTTYAGLLSTDTPGLYGRSLGLGGGSWQEEYYTNFNNITPFTGEQWANVSLQFVTTSSATLAVNGTTYAGTASGGGNNTDGLKIGSYNNVGGYATYNANIDVAEILIYGAALTALQRQQLEGYLAWKWGLQTSLPTGHPFKSTPPAMRFFQPPDIDGNTLWLDAADQGSNSMTLSGSTITAWIDKSGSGTSFASSLSPVVGTLNNRPIVNTTGGGYFANGSFSVPTTYSLFTTGYSTITNTWAGLFYATPDAIFMLRAYLGLMYVFKGNGGTWGANAGTYSSTTTNAIWSVVNPTTTGAVTLYTNGASPQTNSGVTNIASTGLSIGLWASSTYTWKGYIGDVIMYNTGVTDAQRQQVEGYLAWKFGLRGSLLTTHPFYNFPPATLVFNPLLVSSCAFWIDAAEPTTVTSNASSVVTQVADKSPSGRNITNTLTTTGFTWNITKFNSIYPSFYYNSTQNVTLGSNSSFSISQPATVFTVQQVVGSAVAQDVFDSTNSGNRMFGFYFINAGTANYRIYAGTTLQPPGATSSLNPVLYSHYFNGATSQIFENGTSTISGNAGTQGSTGITIGSRFTQNTETFQGHIAEVIYFSRRLSDAERQRIEGYLAWKWGLQRNLSTSHPYYKFRP